MIPLLPPLYQDELLYSLLARIHWLSCSNSPKQTLDELFGNRYVRAGVALQTHLGDLSARLPPKRGLTPEKLAIDTTLFPYLTAFQPREVRDWTLSMLIKGSAEAVYVRLGLVAGTVLLPAALRYCPACRVEMLAMHGELHWRRAHQLPGVLVCSEHKVPLADSMVRPADANQHEFVAADEANCPSDPQRPSWAENPEAMKLLCSIAHASVAYLATPPSPRSLAEWGNYYHVAVKTRGFGKGTASINQAVLLDAYLRHFGPIPHILPGTAPDLWLVGMTRKHREAVAPLRHVLLSLLLDTLLLPERTQPLGPWPCRNPLADHHGQPVITNCYTHEEGGKAVCVFRCSCGFVVSQATAPGSRIRILDHGPLFELRLRELLVIGAGLRATARALAVDPNTVRNHVYKLGLISPWKPRLHRHKSPTPDRESVRDRWSAAHLAAPNQSRKQLRSRLPAEHAWLYRHDHDWLESQPPYPVHPPGKRQRRDWPAIDATMAAKLRQSAVCLRSETPSIRVIRAALERRLGQPNWLTKRLRKLPLCAAVLVEVTEPLKDFQCRRIHWAVEELRRQNLPLALWRLRRMAGLPSHCAPEVEATLQVAEMSKS